MHTAWLKHPLAPYAVATLFPVPFLLLGSVFGSYWILPAFLWLTAVKLLADRLLTERIAEAWRRPAAAAAAGDALPDAVIRALQEVPQPDPAPEAAPEAATDPAPAAVVIPFALPELRPAHADDGAEDGIAEDDAPVDAPDDDADAAPDPATEVEAEVEADPAPDTQLAAEIAALVRGVQPAADTAAPPPAAEARPARTAPLAAPADPVLAGPAVSVPDATDTPPARARRRAIRLPARAAKVRAPRPVLSLAQQADRLSVVLAAVHFLVLAAGLYGLAGGAGYGLLGWLMAFFTFGIWFGQVSNANAHDLIHARDRRLRRLGTWVYISLLNGQHVSAHRLVHHRFVATADDPNTASLGESFYAFAARAWPGAFLAGYEMERAIGQRRSGRGRPVRRLHPYVVYLAGSAAMAAAVLLISGLAGWLIWIALSAHAVIQLLLSDYVQHYGLMRRTLPDGRTEPLGARHSWDAPQIFSSFLTLNAPRHAVHHLHPNRPWNELAAGDGAPQLPYSLAVMGAIALVPPQWHRLMDGRAEALTMSKRAALAARI